MTAKTVSPIRVMLADPNKAVLDTLKEMLEPDCQIVGTARSGADLLQNLKLTKPEVVVLEVGMGDMSGFDVLRQLGATTCTFRCVLLSLYEGVDFVETGLKLGASAYVAKSSAGADLLAAVQRAASERPPRK